MSLVETCTFFLLKRNGSEHTKHFDFGTHFYMLFLFAQLLQRLQPELFPSASFLNTGGISSAAEVFLVLDCGILGLLFNTNLGWSTGCSSTRLPCIKWWPGISKKIGWSQHQVDGFLVCLDYAIVFWEFHPQRQVSHTIHVLGNFHVWHFYLHL